jgi:hypothetical protein
LAWKAAVQINCKEEERESDPGRQKTALFDTRKNLTATKDVTRFRTPEGAKWEERKHPL